MTMSDPARPAPHAGRAAMASGGGSARPRAAEGLAPAAGQAAGPGAAAGPASRPRRAQSRRAQPRRAQSRRPQT